MNPEKLYDAISGFDETYVAAADDTDAVRRSFRKKKARVMKIVGAAALAALALAAGALGTLGRFGNTPAVTPDDPAVTDRQAAERPASQPTEVRPGVIPEETAGTTGADARQPTTVEERPSAPVKETETTASQNDENGAMAPADHFGLEEGHSGANGNSPFQREGDPPVRYRTLVESYGDMEPVKYPWIGPGDHTISKALGDAIAAYGNDNVTYRLRLTAYYEPLAGMTPDAQRAFYLAEADRFRQAVAEVSDKAVFVVESFLDDNTGEETVTFSAHLYDPSFLDSFPDSPDFGYLIELFGEESCVK